MHDLIQIWRRSLGVLLVVVGAMLLVVGLTTANADAATRSNVTVIKERVPGSWGVGFAVRQWNRNRAAGQPRLVIRNRAKHPDVLIRLGRVNGLGTHTERRGTDIIRLNPSPIQRANLTPLGRRVVKRWTTVHELGHELGLGHTANPRSVMSYRYRWWNGRGHVSGYDRAWLRRIR